MRFLILLMLSLTGCSGPNHLGNPLTLPVRGAQASLENAVYDSRRNKVKTHVINNRAALEADIARGSGPTLTKAMDLSGVTTAKRSKLISELRSNPSIYKKTDPEPLVVAFMVYGN